MIINAITGKKLPIYGDGLQIRDWIYVKDHCAAILEILNRGRIGETYCIGGGNEKTNIEIVQTICDILDDLHPRADGNSYTSQIAHVTDRPGHDRRYAINFDKLKHELGWVPRQPFKTDLRETVQWYLSNQEWINGVMKENYTDWIDLNYSGRREVLEQ
jgi:dTDP-glucose 4,6-dehydratase